MGETPPEKEKLVDNRKTVPHRGMQPGSYRRARNTKARVLVIILAVVVVFIGVPAVVVWANWPKLVPFQLTATSKTNEVPDTSTSQTPQKNSDLEETPQITVDSTTITWEYVSHNLVVDSVEVDGRCYNNVPPVWEIWASKGMYTAPCADETGAMDITQVRQLSPYIAVVPTNLIPVSTSWWESIYKPEINPSGDTDYRKVCQMFQNIEISGKGVMVNQVFVVDQEKVQLGEHISGEGCYTVAKVDAEQMVWRMLQSMHDWLSDFRGQGYYQVILPEGYEGQWLGTLPLEYLPPAVPAVTEVVPQILSEQRPELNPKNNKIILVYVWGELYINRSKVNIGGYDEDFPDAWKPWYGEYQGDSYQVEYLDGPWWRYYPEQPFVQGKPWIEVLEGHEITLIIRGCNNEGQVEGNMIHIDCPNPPTR